MNGNVLLLLNLALAFYLVGAIWAIEVDIFRSWKLVGLDPPRARVGADALVRPPRRRSQAVERSSTGFSSGK